MVIFIPLNKLIEMRKVFIALVMLSSAFVAFASSKPIEEKVPLLVKAELVKAQIILEPVKQGQPLTVSVKKSSSCKDYHLECLPTEVAEQIPNEQVLVQYLRNMKRIKHNEDLTKVKLVELGYAFEQGKSYTLLSVGYDKLGAVGAVDKLAFVVPKQSIKGEPKVKIEVLKVATDKVELRFTPNADVAGYGLCVFPKGTIEQQLKQYGRQMGFSTVAEMIKRFSGKNYKTMKTNTWKDLIPNTKYEFCVQTWDKNGLYSKLEKVIVKTKVLGGNGLAKVDIKVLGFGGSEKTGFYQIVEYTPNKQSALHRDIIITEEAFNKQDMGVAGVLKMLKEDQPRNPYWNQYRVDRAQWNAKPNTRYIAFSIAKNARGSWGPLNKVKFTTPASAKK